MVLSVVIVVVACLTIWGIRLHQGLLQVEEQYYGAAGRNSREDRGPAQTIRRADFAVDIGYGIKELLPDWLRE